jgi:molecular chaperone HscB
MTHADHFARFGLARRYGLARKALDAAYERLSFAHHPDLFATAPPDERLEAERTAAAINDAYRVLSSDSERAAYLLALHAAGRALNTEALPPGFLQDMFTLQEEVDELDPGDAARRAHLRGEVERRMAGVLAERAALFGGVEQAPPPAAIEALQAIQGNLNEERYLRRLLERL